jgi:hypothetical protein
MSDKNTKQTEYLTELYTTPGLPTAYASEQALWNSIQETKNGPHTISKDELQRFLQSQEEYTMHKGVKKTHTTQRIIVGGVDLLHQYDLMDVQSISGVNNKYRFLLGVIDTFSRFVSVIPLKDKKAGTVLQGLKKIYEKRDLPLRGESDKGREFLNKQVQDYLKSKEIVFFTPHGTYKSPHIERFWRNLRNLMGHYFTQHNTKRWVGVLDQLMQTYNSRINRSTGVSPIEALKPELSAQIFERLYGDLERAPTHKLHKPKFHIDQTVRMSVAKHPFEKGHEANFTRELYRISQVLDNDPIQYRLEALNKEPVLGKFYESEITPASEEKDKLYLIDKILDRKVENGQELVLVSWLGWDRSHNSWVNATNVIDV